MEQGSTEQKRGSIVPAMGSTMFAKNTGPEVYVDRNRVAIKSYLSYCYLRRNSPQVARNEHARIVRSAAASKQTSKQYDDRSNVALYACLYVHTVEICAQRCAY